MSEYQGKAVEILDVAERMARIGGYDGFSFREIAKEVGVKAASVHYHFPGKADLGAAMARRYTDRFLATLGDPAEGDPQERVGDMIAAFRHALAEEQLMCLCGVLGAEIAKLPDSVAEETRRFFRLNTEWLTTVFTRRDGDAEEAEASALRLLAQLEGAMMVARSIGGVSAFDAVVKEAARKPGPGAVR